MGAPVLVAGFVAVDENVAEALAHKRAQVLLERFDHLLPVMTVRFNRHLIHFERLVEHVVGHWARLASAKGIADPIDVPCARRGVPDEMTLGVRFGTQVDDFIQRDDAFGRHGKHPEVNRVGSGEWQIDGDLLAALDDLHLAHQLLHAAFGSDPRATGRCISHTVVHAKFKT